MALYNTVMPLVSIVTPSFNQAKYLEETILSALGQEYPNIEYIIVDGGSTDGSVEIIRQYADRLAWWVSEKDAGQTDALIKGFAHAYGKYMTWLCSDDVLEPSAISILVDYLERHPDVACSYGDRIRIDAKGNIIAAARYAQFRPWFLRWGWGLPQETSLFRREAYDAVGGLDVSLHMAMDFDLWCKLAKKYAIRHIPAFLGRFRSHPTNKSSIFTRSEDTTGLREGYPVEFAMVYERHFGKPLSGWKRRHCSNIMMVYELLGRFNRQFRRERRLALEKQVA